MNTLELALMYLSLGWSVFPLRQRGKEPFPGFPVATFQRMRLATQAEVFDWWTSRAAANIAIATGAISRLFVLDCDSRQACLEVKARGIPPTRIAATGKGAHIYFSYPDFPVGNRTNLLAGVDIRGNGGYVVAPPSIHPSGKAYGWHREAPIADAPIWLLDMLRPKSTGGASKSRQASIQYLASTPAWARAALQYETEAIRTGAPGNQNNCLNRAAYKMGQLIAMGMIDRPTVERALLDAAVSLSARDGESQTIRTIQSGLNAGLSNPRK